MKDTLESAGRPGWTKAPCEETFSMNRQIVTTDSRDMLEPSVTPSRGF